MTFAANVTHVRAAIQMQAFAAPSKVGKVITIGGGTDSRFPTEVLIGKGLARSRREPIDFTDLQLVLLRHDDSR